jgi:hypothetical protein
VALHEIDKEDVVLYELLLGVERIAQPDGANQLNPTGKGDCFVCASAAIIYYFCKKAGVTPPSTQDIYLKGWADKDIGAATGSSFWSNGKFWDQWQHLLDWWGVTFEMEEDPPIDAQAIEYPNTFGPRYFNAPTLAKRIKCRLEAGYLIHAEIQSNKERELNCRGERGGGADHVVVIDGFRERLVSTLACWGDDGPNWSGTHKFEVHVVDSRRSTPEPFWIDVDDWVADHGGYSMWFIRPDRRKAHCWPAKKPCPYEHVKPASSAAPST